MLMHMTTAQRLQINAQLVLLMPQKYEVVHSHTLLKRSRRCVSDASLLQRISMQSRPITSLSGA